MANIPFEQVRVDVEYKEAAPMIRLCLALLSKMFLKQFDEYSGTLSSGQTTIPHNLGTTPSGYLVLYQSHDEVIRGTPTASDTVGQTDNWSAQNIYVVSTATQVCKIVILK